MCLRGQFLGHFTFLFYTLPLGQIICSSGIKLNCYAQDIQLYLSTPPSTDSLINKLKDCLSDLKLWVLGERLLLAPNPYQQNHPIILLVVMVCFLCWLMLSEILELYLISLLILISMSSPSPKLWRWCLSLPIYDLKWCTNSGSCFHLVFYWPLSVRLHSKPCFSRLKPWIIFLLSFSVNSWPHPPPLLGLFMVRYKCSLLFHYYVNVQLLHFLDVFRLYCYTVLFYIVRFLFL